LVSHHGYCKPSTTDITPPMMSTIVNGVRRSEPVVHNCCPLCWRRESRTAGRPASFCSAIFLFYFVILTI